MSTKKPVLEEYIPLRDVVFKSLREAIIPGQLQSGERLMEIKLSEKMGVSRTPIREAIRKLEQEGLVIMRPRRGAEVAPIDEKNLREILEIRKALESLTGRLASSKASVDDIRNLTNINTAMKRAVDMGDVEMMTEKDVDFHETITRIAGNDHLSEMIDMIREHLYRYRLAFIKGLSDRSVLIEEHAKIIEAIETGDGVGAGQFIVLHIGRQEDYILEQLKK